MVGNDGLWFFMRNGTIAVAGGTGRRRHGHVQSGCQAKEFFLLLPFLAFLPWPWLAAARCFTWFADEGDASAAGPFVLQANISHKFSFYKRFIVTRL